MFLDDRRAIAVAIPRLVRFPDGHAGADRASSNANLVSQGWSRDRTNQGCREQIFLHLILLKFDRGENLNVEAKFHPRFEAMTSSALGGYLAGRLRPKWIGVRTTEVLFRDSAHGFLASREDCAAALQATF